MYSPRVGGVGDEPFFLGAVSSSAKWPAKDRRSGWSARPHSPSPLQTTWQNRRSPHRAAPAPSCARQRRRKRVSREDGYQVLIAFSASSEPSIAPGLNHQRVGGGDAHALEVRQELVPSRYPRFVIVRAGRIRQVKTGNHLDDEVGSAERAAVMPGDRFVHVGRIVDSRLPESGLRLGVDVGSRQEDLVLGIPACPCIVGTVTSGSKLSVIQSDERRSGSLPPLPLRPARSGPEAATPVFGSE
jgi:hypothetical protein